MASGKLVHKSRRQMKSTTLDNNNSNPAPQTQNSEQNPVASRQNSYHRYIRQTLTSHTSVSSATSGGGGGGGSGTASPFASARSATPLSGRQQQQQRTTSSCSTLTNTSATEGQGPEVPVGQCRICRKFIFANETCHLCSACDQFVCEDCGSYSATDQHWMCSSCRRRATKPAIPADALKELGLNQNSSAVRRMTLRLNQNELKRAIGKGSGESDPSSSSSSSGCSSSQSTAANLATLAASTTAAASSAAITTTARRCPTKIITRAPSVIKTPPLSQFQQPEPEVAASKTKSSKVAAAAGASGRLYDDSGGRNQAGSGRAAAAAASSATRTPEVSSGFNVSNSNKNDSQRQQQIRAQQMKQACDRRTTTAAVTQAATSRQQILQRRGSACGDLPTSQTRAPVKPPLAELGNESSSKQANLREQAAQKQHYQQQKQQQQQLLLARRASAAVTTSDSSRSGSIATMHPVQTKPFQDTNRQFQDAAAYTSHHHQEQGNIRQQQPHTMVTASSDLALDTPPLNHPPMNFQAYQQQLPVHNGSTLIPIPPEQMHLRRLSDQSNLVRRSSIISDTLNNPVAFTRNRSHSNIDTIESLTYLYQQQQPTTFNMVQPNQPYSYQPACPIAQRPQQQQQPVLHRGLSTDDAGGFQGQGQNQLNVVGYASQRRPSDQWVLQQHVAAQQEALGYTAKQYQQQQQQQQTVKGHLSSIITPYSQKKRQTSEDQHSDSSSDIDEDLRDPQMGQEFDNEQPNEYFAPPRSAQSNYIVNYQQQQPLYQLEQALYSQSQQPPISIPSVSVSEFSSSQQRLNQIHHQQPPPPQQQQQQNYDQIMTTPMQINLAIEQAIQQQQRRLSNEFLGGQGYLMPRRGSSGRVLPKIPGEQSRSMMDLPQNNQTNGSINGSTNGFGERQVSTLDLPSPTIRRASAPEGQNIKIVVDDMDGTGGGPIGGKQNRNLPPSMKGELYERLVLYRDDSLDPNMGMAHGFGLQVMGGKLDEDNKLQALVSWVLPGGPADKVGMKAGDRIVEWDGKCLVNMSYEQVADVIESSANIAELLVRPAHRLDTQPGANLVRSQRRMSQQTERDLKRFQASTTQDPASLHNKGHRMSYCCQDSSITTTTTGSGSRKGSLIIDNGRYYQQGINTTQESQFSKQRAGTGRRLPQIPGFSLTSEGNSYTSCGQTVLMAEDQANCGLLSAQNYSQQHSLSTGELYPGSGCLNSIGATSVDVLNQVQLSGSQQWQMGAIQDNLAHSSMATDQLGGEVCGLIGLQVNVDERVAQLEVSVLSAINIDKNPSLDYYVRVRILPESKRFKACATQPNCDMNWKETFIFQNFPVQQIHRMALEIGIWIYDEAPRLSAHKVQPIGEALIPIHSARERNTDFWPLRPPPSTPQSRRKSLNDLMATSLDLLTAHKLAESRYLTEMQTTNGGSGRLPINNNNNQPQAHLQTSGGYLPPAIVGGGGSSSSTLAVQGQQDAGGGGGGGYANELIVRQRSSSNKNLPDASKLCIQLRRASDELAGSTTHKFVNSRTSPAASRRSISVINVGNDGQSTVMVQNGASSRSMSRGGVVGVVQANVALPIHGKPLFGSRRDLTLQQQQQHPVTADTAIAAEMSKYDSPVTATGPRPSIPSTAGRRYSLIGIQSMSGYRSQKSSQSGSTDQDSPRRLVASIKWPSTHAGGQQSGLVSATRMPVEPSKQPYVSSNNLQRCSESGSGSRRGSTEQQQQQLGYQYQRKGSFAMQTLRKLKRTMSLTKGGDPSNPDGNPDSRRSSSTSTDSHLDLDEDVGLSRRLQAHKGYVGRLKLSFILTKGQLEVDVIAAQGLQFDQDFCLGIYVKMYLKGKSRTNKRKTRIVQPAESPIFKQLIKYDGSLVDNKVLDISVWQKQSGLKGKVPIGFTEVQLAELNLEQLQTSWYNLRPMEVACNSSSIEE